MRGSAQAAQKASVPTGSSQRKAAWGRSLSDALAEAGCADVSAQTAPSLAVDSFGVDAFVPAMPPVPNGQARVAPVSHRAPLHRPQAGSARPIPNGDGARASLVKGPDLPRIAQPPQLRPGDAVHLPWVKSAQRRRSKARTIGILAWMTTALVTGATIAATAAFLSGPPPSQSAYEAPSGTQR